IPFHPSGLMNTTDRTVTKQYFVSSRRKSSVCNASTPVTAGVTTQPTGREMMGILYINKRAGDPNGTLWRVAVISLPLLF
ncbi:MAG: hypothetical protein MJY50_02555, partial [Bacteroidales bacterium]|nr:hypothetical protein [Bacteroidales bacterium]